MLIRALGIDIHKTLSAISPYFSIAAGFGNVHGVYKPGNVKLHPELLGKHQAYVKEQTGSKDEKPAFLVFHGGSGSSKAEYSEAISHGVVKVNLDTDLQYAYLTGIRDYVLKKKDYIMSQVGNPEGEDKPNKKYFDPRVWVREGEKTMSARVQEGTLAFPPSGALVELALDCLLNPLESALILTLYRTGRLQYCQPALREAYCSDWWDWRVEDPRFGVC